MRDRIAKIEGALGAPLLDEYIAFLGTHGTDEEGELGVPFRGELWPVRSLYELSKGLGTHQLDVAYFLVHDVLPRYYLPIGEDWGGNFFGLFVAGENAGCVAWWNHERSRGDDSVEQVSSSFQEFLESLRPVGSENG